MSSKKRIYIAGPDLFLPDWPERAAQATALCAEHGLEAVLPVPATMLTGPGVTEPSDAEAANKVFQSCLEAVRNADGVIANLTPFRGSEPDSGTVTECALAYAWGKPVIGYFNGPALPVPEDADTDGRVLAEDGGWIEQFGLTHNVMLHGVCMTIVEDPLKAVVMMASMLRNGQ
ncbi:nucleoside 2-deoxyribosyltransferase [Acidithiobacillus ferrooxidans]|uniref:nucleoside 2-deoxyribosyltransferase n=1 Tax=Acidithiobacillus ferrooxidans TaxID=920 RepID=UPI001C066D6F|nr:nucleoside 2-deoxyribosyltransferase [Acidithiobacillus ferrooxidans]MBU2774197.1 nucleoside 2-deoxyribosyltransferase [Acidithiobacillus ferrooxidans]